MGQVALISLDHMRATHHLSQLRQRMHECFDQWLDMLEPSLDDKPMSLPDLTAVMGQLRQDLMGSLSLARNSNLKIQGLWINSVSNLSFEPLSRLT